MTTEELIQALEAEWSPDDGFFWDLRSGKFSSDASGRVLGLLRGVSLDAASAVPLRLVSLLWYIPQFMGWQAERIRQTQGDVEGYERVVASFNGEVERILGVP